MNTSNITNYKPKDFAELLGVSIKTLQRWDREGILKANRTPTDRSYYTYGQYFQFKGINIEHEELVQDIISILHEFSCRLYGLRKYKKQIEKDEEIAEELQDRDRSYRRAEDQNT